MSATKFNVHAYGTLPCWGGGFRFTTFSFINVSAAVAEREAESYRYMPGVTAVELIENDRYVVAKTWVREVRTNG
jgi:hypothetical protein